MSDYKTLPDLPGFEIYADGRIKSAGKPSLNKHPRWLTACPNKGGYLSFSGPYINGKRRTEVVHRVVCRAFHGERPFWAQCIRHLDGNKLNNSADNLSWGTSAENMEDRRKHGRDLFGERNHMVKFPDSEIPVIKELYKSGLTQQKIADKYGVTQVCISEILRGKTRNITV